MVEATGATLNSVRFTKDVAAAVRASLVEAGVAVADAGTGGDTVATDGSNPECPLVVFINSKSGGGLGKDLFDTLTRLIGPVQVFDLSKSKPNAVLAALLGSLDRLAGEGNADAQAARQKLRVAVAGGDGTVGWLLSVLEAIPSPPPVGVIPLGTGNDLSRSYGWGPTFASASDSAVTERLLAIAAAKPHAVDGWSIQVTPSPDLDASQLHLPYAIQKQEGETASFKGNFYLYFSLGMDAQVALGFHTLRNTKPWLASGRMANQAIYASYGCTQGWFCTCCTAQPQARCIHMIAAISIQKAADGPWEDLDLPNDLRALAVLNLQSYAGGRNPWGTGAESEWKQARPDDGLLELIGFKGGWHTMMVMGKMAGGVRLAQAHGLRIDLRGEHRRAAYMQIDGEPWEEPLSVDSREPTRVEIIPRPVKSVMVAPEGCAVHSLPALS
eukprot:TRINITY_DN69469_c0_g1_i1.p1 TRINITY_DN69469_c0_g1~~TRINITY_DN69469_c0_g1_i1.p1  ORF type:complete len:442 (-),score=5.48 TRINITY_DN69469_c0_g1_i1:295-1620(-)